MFVNVHIIIYNYAKQNVIYKLYGVHKMEKNKLNNKRLKILKETYPDVKAGLFFETPFELLIATILSAQCTDRQVNKVTKELYKKYKSAADFAKLKPEELGIEIRSCGFYKNKSKNIINACKILDEEYNGEVPKDIDVLQKLPGVGRKTANVVVSNAFGIPAIAVDTHVFRVTNRIGLAHAKNVLDTEKQLMKVIPQDNWSDAHHQLIWHGRFLCKARKPLCVECPLNDVCEYNITNNKQTDKDL